MNEQPHRETYLTDSLGPLPFCPGCGHSLVVKALDKALVKLQLDPAEVVVVTDIGCIGLADRYFTTSAFHGLHGRSITYACGIKLAKPDLHVIALKGDGGCGIGGTHLLNVARRNIGISLIVSNNFNYGMTGGQHSVTTFTEGITSTTPWGNIEAPMDLCRTAAAAGAAWVHRATSFDKDLADILAEAIEQPGFAMVDVIELCTAYYSPRNQLKRKDLMEMLDSYELELGRIADQPRPEYSLRYYKAFEAGKAALRPKPTIDKKFDHRVDGQTGIVIAGSAGQKVKSSATVFGQAAIFSGLETTQKDDYPITVMTGHSLAEIIVSPDPIDYTAIEVPDIMVVISEDGLAKSMARIQSLASSSLLYIDESLELPDTAAKVVQLPLAATAKRVSKLSIAIIAFAAVLADTDLFPPAALEKAIATFQKKKIAETNIAAVAAGTELVSACT